MRMSDWSSDVCSSDLLQVPGAEADGLLLDHRVEQAGDDEHRPERLIGEQSACSAEANGAGHHEVEHHDVGAVLAGPIDGLRRIGGLGHHLVAVGLQNRAEDGAEALRTDEHTAELQYTM